jgi:hypothetical protein
MEKKDLESRKENLISLATEIDQVIEKIKALNDADKTDNAKNGRMEFAYVKYYLAEVSLLLHLSLYLLEHEKFSKYIYSPTRLIMEIVLQLEHVYSVKEKKGLDAVRRLFFKDIAISAKSTLSMPGEGGKGVIKKQINLLDIASKILKLDFKTDDVSAKSSRDIKSLCDKSNVVIKKCTGSDLYSFYELLSESSHANVVSIGASNHKSDEVGTLGIFELTLELTIRFCEIIIIESEYEQLEDGLGRLKKILGVT